MALLNRSFLYGVLAGSGIFGIVKWLHKKLRARKRALEFDCLFFSPGCLSLKCMKKSQPLCNILDCSFCNFKRFLSLLRGTQQSLDVCVYLITADEIADIILSLLKKGIFVRIILDHQMSQEAYNSKMIFFMREHIPLKLVRTGKMMHNKFAVIDSKILITGSFNWTIQGATNNYENAVIIRNEETVRKYETYFHYLWHDYSNDEKN